jgi:DNA-binding NarL/FixJ family response regulator
MLDVSADRGKFTRCIRLVIADPQPIVLQGLRSAFATQRDFEIVAACSSGTSCLEAIRSLTPDAALLADTWPDLTVSEILAVAKTESLSTRLVLFTQSESQGDLASAIAAGACSTISKYASPETMVRSLRLTTGGIGAPEERSQDLSSNGKEIDGAKIDKMLKALTDRENQIVRLVSEGLSNKEIARQLNVSQGTIKVHLYNIFQKLEISNRTVLATISFLQRSAGFGTLSLALALAIRDDAKASNANDNIPDDDSTAYKNLEQSVLEPWRNMILRQIVVDAGEAVALAQNGASITLSQSTHSAARTEGMHEQAVLSKLGRSYGPIGSGAPFLSISPLLQAIKNGQSDDPTNRQQPQSVSNSVKNGDGYTTSAEPAGVWINARNSLHAVVRALALGEPPIDASAVDTAQGATITIDGSSDVDPHQVDSRASESDILSDNDAVDFVHGGPGSETIKGYDAADTVQEGSFGSAPNNGNDIVVAGSGDDQLTGSNGDDTFVDLSAKDSRSARFDTTVDFKSGTNQINLATLGALAFLPLTPTSKSVPAHTVAWIYDPVSNETIIYVNQTDGSLDIGDSALLEFHLQGEVSVAESSVVDEPDAAAVAAALEGIDPALLTATEASSSESTFGTAGVWTMPADDGARFNFGRDHTGSVGSSRLTIASRDSANAVGESNDGAGAVQEHESSIELAQSHASVLIEEDLTHKTGSAQTNIGAVTTGHGGAHATAGLDLFEPGVQYFAIAVPIAVASPVQPGVITDNSESHGNSQQASQSASAGSSAADESADSGIVPGNGNGNAQHASNPAGSKASAVAGSVEPDVKTHKSEDYGNSQHASQPASAGASAADESADPGVVRGNGNAQHASNLAAADASAVADPIEPVIVAGNSEGHGNSQQASQPASSATAESAESGNGSGNGNGNSQHAADTAAAKSPAVADPVELDIVADNSEGHGNSQHASQSASAGPSAADE